MASTMVNDNHVASSQADTNSDADDMETNSTNMTGTEDEELEEIKARVREMEEEAEKLKQMQDDILASANQSMFSSSGRGGRGRGFGPMDDDTMLGDEKDLEDYDGGGHYSSDDIAHDGSLLADDSLSLTPEEKAEIDARSIFVGNVDYSATADDLEKHFHGCGSINRVTILCDKYTGHPKGYAYIEFGEKDSVETATALDDSLFKGRQIKVTVKRTNRPGLSTTNRPPRGRGRGGRGGFGRGSFGGYGGGGGWGAGGYHPRGGRRPFRSRGWHGYTPY